MAEGFNPAGPDRRDIGANHTGENQMTLRETAKASVLENVTECATYQHHTNYHKLHIRRDGSAHWSESINRTDDIIDDRPESFAAVPSVACVGTGSYACNCDHCADKTYDTITDAISDAVSEYGTGDIEDEMIAAFDRIPQGYFEDEFA